MTIRDLKAISEEDARTFIEGIIWPHGPACPFCGNVDQERIRKVKPNKAKRIRDGLYVCLECKPKKQFTVTKGTVLESTHLPMKTWVYLVATLANAKKGHPTRQLQRELKAMGANGKYGNFQSLWHATMRIRHALRATRADGQLGGQDKILEADELWVGPKPRGEKKKRNEDKVPVIALVERGGGVRTTVGGSVDAVTLRNHLLKHADTASKLMTDEHKGYKWPGSFFTSHETVNHSKGEYARGIVFNNTAESFFSMVRRSHAVYHKWSVRLLPYYLAEREFTWMHKNESDMEKVRIVFKRMVGKRLYYKEPKRESLWRPDSLLDPERPPIPPIERTKKL